MEICNKNLLQMHNQLKANLLKRYQSKVKKPKPIPSQISNNSDITLGNSRTKIEKIEESETQQEYTIMNLQEQVAALQNEKQNWLAFQSYFESQLGKFSAYTSGEDFSSFIYTFNQAKANSSMNYDSQQILTNLSQEKNLSTTVFDSRPPSSLNQISDHNYKKTHFTPIILKDSQDQFKKFQEQFNIIIQTANQSTSKKNQHSNALQQMIKQIKDLFDEMTAFYNQISNLQVKKIILFDNQVKEDESIQDLVRQNLLLEKQIQLLISQDGKNKVKIQTANNNKHLEQLVHYSKRIATETKEETEIFQLTAQLLSNQVDQLNQQITQLLEENMKLKQSIQELEQIHNQKVINLKTKSKNQKNNIKELEKKSEKIIEELENAKHELEIAKQNTRPQCNIIIHQVDDHHIFSCEQQVNIEESNKSLEQQIAQLRKALINFDKEQKEKDNLIKDMREQIQNLQEQIDVNQDKLKEKIQENTTYLTQIQEINRMTSQAKLHRAIIAQLSEDNDKLKKQISNLNDQIATYLSLEQETRNRQQSSLKKETTAQNLHKEMTRLKEESRNAQETLSQRIIDNQNQQLLIAQLTLQRDQLQAEINELIKQNQKEKKPPMVASMVNEDNNDEFQRIHQENRQKMIQMKSKLLGLKNNIEKHGEKVGVLKTHNKTAQEIAQETENQKSIIISELMGLIDQITELQRKIDQDYESNFTKMNEKQRILLQQNMQLKQDLKKYQNMEVEIKNRNEEINKLTDQLKMIRIEYREYQDIMKSKIAQFQNASKKEINEEITPEDIEMHKNLKEVEKLQRQLNDAQAEISMLKSELKNRQQTQVIPPEILQQLQQMTMLSIQEDSMVRSAARTIQQNNLEVKQADILHKKINDLTEKLSNKTLEAQRYKSESRTLEDQFKQEKQEWLNQIEKREKQYQVLETKYKKCLEQYEDLQQTFFKVEEQLNKNEQGHQTERIKTFESDSD